MVGSGSDHSQFCRTSAAPEMGMRRHRVSMRLLRGLHLRAELVNTHKSTGRGKALLSAYETCASASHSISVGLGRHGRSMGCSLSPDLCRLSRAELFEH